MTQLWPVACMLLLLAIDHARADSLPPGARLRLVMPAERPITRVGFSPDGKIIAAQDEGGMIRL